MAMLYDTKRYIFRFLRWTEELTKSQLNLAYGTKNGTNIKTKQTKNKTGLLRKKTVRVKVIVRGDVQMEELNLRWEGSMKLLSRERKSGWEEWWVKGVSSERRRNSGVGNRENVMRFKVDEEKKGVDSEIKWSRSVTCILSARDMLLTKQGWQQMKSECYEDVEHIKLVEVRWFVRTS